MKLKYSQDYTYYTNNIVYAVSPEFKQYFESVRSKLINNKVYINIEARFYSRKETFFAIYNSIDTLVKKLNKEIEIQTKSAQEFHIEIMTISEDYFTHSKLVQLTDCNSSNPKPLCSRCRIQVADCCYRREPDSAKGCRLLRSAT